MPQRNRVYFWVGPLIALSWLSLVFVDPDRPGPATLELGYVLGSLFAHATLAAAWTAFGPGRLQWRGPLSLIWLGMLPVVIAMNVAINGGPAGDVVLLVGIPLLAQWLILQIPFWGLALVFGLGLYHLDDLDQAIEGRRLCFGIRHLLLVMLITSVVLGLGRIVVSNISQAHHEGPIFLFLAAAAIVVTLPLLLAALMRRLAILGISLSLGLIGVATPFELSLMQTSGAGPGPRTEDFIAINVASALLILLIAGIVRWNGYCLSARSPLQVSSGP